MKFLADESVDRQIVERLREEHFDVHYVAELTPAATDDESLEKALADRAVLVTADRDFGEIVFRRGQPCEGVVLVRLRGLSAETKATIVLRAVQEHGEELAGAFTVVDAGWLRIRPLPGGG